MTVGYRSEQLFNRYATVQRGRLDLAVNVIRNSEADFHGKLFNLASNSLGVKTATAYILSLDPKSIAPFLSQYYSVALIATSRNT